MSETKKVVKNIHQRLNAVMKKVAYVQKDKEIGKPGSSYAYWVATYDQILAVVRKDMVAQGIIVVTRQMGPGKLAATGTYFAGKEGKEPVEAMRYEAMYEIDFVNMDDPENKVTFPIEAHAIDQGDKAPGKAQTYATKAAIKKALLLESGDEEESRADTVGGGNGGDGTVTTVTPAQRPAAKSGATVDTGGPPASEGQIKFIGKKLEAAGKTEAELLTRLGRTALAGMTEGEAKLALDWVAGKLA